MSAVLNSIGYIDADIFPYDIEEKGHLRRYIEGDEYDPVGEFLLSSDTWNAWRYARDPRPTDSDKFTFRFANLRSRLKPFVKRYCKEVLLDSDRPLGSCVANLPAYIRPADAFLLERSITSLDLFTNPDVFQELWDSLIPDRYGTDELGRYPQAAVERQRKTQPFWLWLRSNYGFPRYVPPVAPHFKRKLVEIADDESKIIPDAVIQQLANKLAAHRNGISHLNPFNHLRLCVLILAIAIGRRIGEVFSLRRGTKKQPPLVRYPARGGCPEGALWLRFRPNKGGRSEHVYISPEWEDVTIYCIDELCRYSDQIRSFAEPEERDLLILVSTWNWTAGGTFSSAIVPAVNQDFAQTGALGGYKQPRPKSFIKHASALSYKSLHNWLNGNVEQKNPPKRYYGVMHEWKITIDGSAEGEIYRFCTHYARHTRQTVLAREPQISILTRQRDLNHTNRNMQVHYQHQGKEQNRHLLERMRKDSLFGKAAEVLKEIPELEMLGVGHDTSDPQSKFQAGRPKMMDERWRGLYKEHRRLFEHASRVPGGICSKPDGGPKGCKEYMNCMNAHEGGCVHFCTDPNDPAMMGEIVDNTRELRRKHQASESDGRLVQAGKHEVLARRAEEFRDEALKRSPPEVIAHLNERLLTLKEDGL